MAKYLSENGVLYLVQKLKDIFVKKEPGKGLSTNDLTDELKEKILNAGDSSFSGNYEDLYNKPTIPSAVSQLTNDAGYQTASQVASAIANAGHLKRVIVTELPAKGEADEHTIYMVEEEPTGSNRYKEWMLIEGEWESIGSSDADLTDYLKKEDMVAITNAEIDSIASAVFT